MFIMEREGAECRGKTGLEMSGLGFQDPWTSHSLDTDPIPEALWLLIRLLPVTASL